MANQYKYDKYVQKSLYIQKGGYTPSLIFVDTYYDFFEKTLKKYNYIRNQYGFNMSMCKLDNNMELYCVRYLGTIPAYFDEEIIPGNYSNTSKKFIKAKTDANIKFGKNFFWNSWTETLLDNTIFFVGSYKNKKLIVNYNIKPYIISNKHALTNINEGTLKYNDVRLCNLNNKIYCYDGLITSIYEVKVIENTIYVPLFMDEPIYESHHFYFKNKLCNTNKLCNINTNDEYFKKFDKNWSIVEIIKKDDNKYFEFINWYENGYVTNTLINMKTGGGIKNNIIKMENDIIDGLGNAYLPMFSFGTPFLKIENADSNIIFTGIAVGHTKIIILKSYDNENIDNFIKKKIELLDILDNYIQHNSYIYLAYYIKLIKYKDGTYDMFISDSYLYIDMSQKYIFSICFPMGIIEKNNKYVMSHGYGDYYNYMVEYDKNKLLKKIKHNVKLFDKSKYKFKIIKT